MTHTKDEALEALILKTGMNPVMQGSCYVMHPEALQAVIGEALKQALAAPTVQEPVLKPLSKKWKWVLHESFADVAGFDEEGIPSFYWKESVTKFKSGELSAPCKGKNCGSLNGWLHSSECRAEHEAQYTTPPAAPVQEPVGTYGEIFESMQALLRTGLQRDQQIYMEMKDKPLYTTPPAAQRQWVGLTAGERDALFSNTIKGKKLVNWVARSIEAKLKEKNNG
jgi:hypothetical protein